MRVDSGMAFVKRVSQCNYCVSRLWFECQSFVAEAEHGAAFSMVFFAARFCSIGNIILLLDARVLFLQII